MKLSGLNSALSSVFTKKGEKNKPSSLEQIYYLFWEKGIDYNAFNELPIPYIMGIVKAHTYKLEQEEKAAKKADKKK